MNGQWWSNNSTHLSQNKQWNDVSLFINSQYVHKFIRSFSASINSYTNTTKSNYFIIVPGSIDADITKDGIVKPKNAAELNTKTECNFGKNVGVIQNILNE